MSAADLPARVNEFVQWLFADYRPSIPKGPKVFNDALLGNQYFASHEVAIIDSPLLQRLKRIRQTGLVYQVFPSARHSRFEHSLGVVTLAERCFNAIQDRASLEDVSLEVNNDRYRGDLAHLRMAALLHDAGHGLCSHASEQISEYSSDLREFKRNPQFIKNAPGEIISHLITKSPFFREWFDGVANSARPKATIDLDLVAEMILGRHRDPEKFFLAQIVSSPYDADKLDYIARDSFYCGLALTVDLPRFYSMIAVTKYEDKRILVLRSYVPLEQILFSKMTLYSAVYHHQKVKCLDHMLRSLVQHIIENPGQCSVPVVGKTVTFADPVQYLYVTDEEFFNQHGGFGDQFVKSMLNRFARRDLFVRCVEVSRRTVKNWAHYGRKRLVDLSKDFEGLAAVENEIHKRLPPDIRSECSAGEAILSVPPPPGMATDNAFIQVAKDSAPESVAEFFPVEQWVEAYSHNKWRAFVYSPKKYAKAVRDAAVSVLADEEFRIEVRDEVSNEACHLE